MTGAGIVPQVCNDAQRNSLEDDAGHFWGQTS
jgi:hypothetical protein